MNKECAPHIHGKIAEYVARYSSKAPAHEYIQFMQMN
jgi:hypothetical protein